MIWKASSAVLALACGMLFALWQQGQQSPVLSDPRLIGTWVSDRERTLQDLEAQWQVSEQRLADLGQLLGRLRLTFSRTQIRLEMDDFVESMPYTVVAVDQHSVVIQEQSDPQLESLESSSFTMIHFDGDDAYWVMSELGGFPEYFRRVEFGSPTI